MIGSPATIPSDEVEETSGAFIQQVSLDQDLDEAFQPTSLAPEEAEPTSASSQDGVEPFSAGLQDQTELASPIPQDEAELASPIPDRKSTRLNSSHT